MINSSSINVIALLQIPNFPNFSPPYSAHRFHIISTILYGCKHQPVSAASEIPKTMRDDANIDA